MADPAVPAIPLLDQQLLTEEEVVEILLAAVSPQTLIPHQWLRALILVVATSGDVEIGEIEAITVEATGETEETERTVVMAAMAEDMIGQPTHLRLKDDTHSLHDLRIPNNLTR